MLLIEDCLATPDEKNKMKDTPFQEALGLLMWLQVATRPDLAFSVNILAHFAYNPGKAHWNALKHILAYVKGTKHYGITYKSGSSLELIGYIDSNYACCRDTRQSTKGNIFLVAGSPISWECKRQDTVALFTVEAEFMAFLKATTQALWMSKYFHEVGLPVNKPLTICADNSRSIANSTTEKNHQCTKHIDIWHHCKGTTLGLGLVTWVGSHLRAVVSLIAFPLSAFLLFCVILCEPVNLILDSVGIYVRYHENGA